MKNLTQAIVDYAKAAAVAEKSISKKEKAVVIDVAMLNLEFARKQLSQHGVNLPVGMPQ